ncbi:MAG: NADH-quinone oxidoreductase subunit N [Chitinophagaceae bacterium]|nr:NADH-quinone oxidoreductase subunit N [Chitinophagaceae bacterium]
MIAIIVAALLGVLMMFTAIFIKKSAYVQAIALIGITLLMGITIYEHSFQTEAVTHYFNNMIAVSFYSLWFNVILTFATMMYFFIFHNSISKVGKNDAEYFALLFFILCGAYLLSSYANLLILFIGIEILSIPQYILAGSDKENLKSNEASLKYFLMGAFSTGLLLMGITLIYGSTGTFDISQMNFLQEAKLSALPFMGIMLLLISFGFKVSAAPMHWWTADVYDGTPTAFTPFMATIVKFSAFVAFLRLFHNSFGQVGAQWQVAMTIIVVITLIIGNVTALYQQSVKRMLAYSSIAQAGFMLFAVFAINQQAEKAMIYYGFAYTLASLGIFAVLIRLKDYTFEGFNGLARKEPVLAITATISLLSLAGIPITSGFFAKYLVLQSYLINGNGILLLILAVLMAAVGCFYYFKVIQSIYFKDGKAELKSSILPYEKALLIINAILIILLGIFPSSIIG